MSRWLLAAFCLVTSPLAAQQDSLMLEAIRLATEGRGDSARAIVQGQLKSVSSIDPYYSEVLYTGGVVSDDPATAMTYFRRVAIEYSNSHWADRALLRIAQLSYASSDLDAAIRSTERILVDYPLSEIRSEASFLAARAYLDQRDTEAGCRLLDQARQEAGENVEIQNRAAFYLQRCAEILAADSVGGPPASQPPTRPAGFSVQVAAVGNAAAADELMRALQREGHDATVVREDGLLKVRVGRFRTRNEAQEFAATLRQEFGGQPFVVAYQ